MPAGMIRKTHLSSRPIPRNAWESVYTITLIMILSALAWGDPDGIGRYLAAREDLVFHHHEYWRLLTSLGVHKDLQHFLGNVVFLGGLGFLLRNYFGRLAFPFLSVLAGAGVNLLTLLFYGWAYAQNVTLIGASGMVYFMAGFWQALYFGIERRLSVGRRIMSCVAFTLVVFAPTTYEHNVSYAAHGIGLIVGILTGAGFFFVYRRDYRQNEVMEPNEDFESEDFEDEWPEQPALPRPSNQRTDSSG